MMATLIAKHLVYHWYLLMGLYLALMMASTWAHLTVKFWSLHLEIMMESHLGLMKEQYCNFQMYPLMVIMLASLRVSCLQTHW